ncbi:CDP-archaeol synthase [Clostridium lacusfryxellense]|uniref:CDP-archaeol synthase n=1 Tax=Clostridium lacusfryxellense TaxID=205328 RepID=UPI001C0C23E4|nr:CDP-archaeol synthase [Clostridium lacusfryxellense]MBU3113398.1 CDP-archaeol synthase [Clostridium lacusfryxellense]
MIVIFTMYITLIPVIFAGILNMVWVKLPYMSLWTRPMDNNKCFYDGKRIFGDNKTWKGFIGMIVFAIVSTIIWGLICANLQYLNDHNYLYRNYDNSLSYNVFIGFLLGLAYALLELPNSFLKRRINIIPGKTSEGIKSIFFVLLDQADSIFGCVLVICLVYKMSIKFYLAYVLLGALTHIVINMLLYLGKLRKNMF